MADLDTPVPPDRRIRVTPLVFGLAFAAIGITYLAGAVVDDATWIWVVGLTALAVAGIASAIRS